MAESPLDKALRLNQASQEKKIRLNLITINSITDADILRLQGNPNATRVDGFDAYEVEHQGQWGKDYLNSYAGQKKMNR